MTEVSERVILEEGSIKITNRSAIIGSKTYSLENTASVNLTVRHDKGLIPLILILMGAVLGILFIINSITPEGVINWGSMIIGGIIALALIGFGFFIHVRSMPLYIVKLESSAGEIDILQSYDQKRVRRIIDAVNKAIGRKN